EFFARVEYGPDTGIHVHVVIPFMAHAQAHDQGDDAKLVWNTWGMAKYLSKPGDSRAALFDDQRQVVPAELADAIALYLVEQSRNFRQRHEAAKTKGKLPKKTRLPSLRFSSEGLPTEGELFAQDQCVMLMHPYQWYLHPDPHGENTSDEQVRSKQVWTQVMTRRLRRPCPPRPPALQLAHSPLGSHRWIRRGRASRSRSVMKERRAISDIPVWFINVSLRGWLLAISPSLR
ncbi:hypothetical protein IHN59_20115, partial [Deinococcus sp. 23YEL01]|nr:hypothetical protein [Deinococcus sp. 23YEL01]